MEKSQDPFVSLVVESFGSEGRGTTLFGPEARSRVSQNGGEAPSWDESLSLSVDNPALAVVKVRYALRRCDPCAADGCSGVRVLQMHSAVDVEGRRWV